MLIMLKYALLQVYRAEVVKKAYCILLFDFASVKRAHVPLETRGEFQISKVRYSHAVFICRQGV